MPVAMRAKSKQKTPGEPPVMVAVAASGASLASLNQLFKVIGKSNPASYVVVLRQVNGVNAEEVADELARLSGLPAQIVGDQLIPQAGNIYVTPHGALTRFEDGHVRVTPAPEAPEHRASIDSLLTSLAEAYRHRSIGVVLSHLNADGLAGIASLKENGGLAIAEYDPQGSSPPALDPAGVADFVLPVEKIAEQINVHVKHLAVTPSIAEQAEAVEAGTRTSLNRIAAVLRNATGHDFHGYKQNTFIRRVQRRMQVRQIDHLEAYVDFLRAEPEEVGRLFQDLLIGVTQFFRDLPEFSLLETDVVPKLFAGKGASDQVRVWVLGCATGEEAYSIAILLREHMAGLDIVPPVQIFATDIDGRALNLARAGRYPESIAKDVSPERLSRWFIKEGATYSVVKELREMCIFSQHNVIRDAPFSRTDLVSCRNLLIYLTAELQDRVIPLFHFALRPGGFLFLGPSETVTRHAKLFAPLDRRHRIFRRLESHARVLPQFPLAAGARGRMAPSAPSERRVRADNSLAKQAERIVERYAPAYVLLDDQYEVLQFSGRTGRYLEPAAGAANLNLLNLVHRDLRIDLRSALHTAANDKAVVKLDRLRIESDGEPHLVDLVVEPLQLGEAGPNFIVLFRDGGAAAPGQGEEAPSAAALRDEHVLRLEAELRLTKERLQATIEELESTNEELKSSNEEYQSINEELQSANEELETSKEELQSVNEELQTVNGELAHRVNELAKANSDMKNLLESTQIATVFLDNDLRIKTFTPSIAEVFHLVETDHERPISHIASRVLYPQLEEDAQRVIRTLGTIEREVVDASGAAHYLVRVLPYRSVDNFIAGVVITFADVSEIVRARSDLHESEERYRLIVESARDYAIVSMDAERTINGWNPGAENIFGWRSSEIVGQKLDLLFTPEDRMAGAAAAEIKTALRDGRAGDDRWHQKSDGSRFWGSGILMPLRDRNQGFVKILHDRTQEREQVERQKLLTAELQHRVKNILAVVRSVSQRTLEKSADLEEFRAHFDGRLRALARTQSVLVRSASGLVSLDELVRDEMLSHAAQEGDQVSIDGPPVTLRDRQAEIVSLALHELATNAVKYGALSRTGGHVSVAWQVFIAGAEPRLSLSWIETGVPVMDANPRRHGFGRELIERGLPYELDAATSLEFAPGGVRCTIELAIDELEEPSEDEGEVA